MIVTVALLFYSEPLHVPFCVSVVLRVSMTDCALCVSRLVARVRGREGRQEWEHLGMRVGQAAQTGPCSK